MIWKTAPRRQGDNLITDSVKVLYSTQHKRGHFRDVLHSQSLGLLQKKLKLLRQRRRTSKYTDITQSINVETKTRFSGFVRHPAWKWILFLQPWSLYKASLIENTDFWASTEHQDLKHICSPSLLLNWPVRQRLWSHGNMALYKFCIVLYCIVYPTCGRTSRQSRGTGQLPCWLARQGWRGLNSGTGTAHCRSDL